MNQLSANPFAAKLNRLVSHRHLPVYLCIVAFIIRFICIISGEYALCSDAGEFWKIARNLVAGKGFTLNGLPTAYRMPGFPMVLWLFGLVSTNLLWLRSVLALFEVATGVLIYLLAKRHFGTPPAIVALAVWSLLPISVVQPMLFMSEGVSTLLLVALLLVVTNPASLRTTIIGGLICGCLILIKQHLLLFPAVFAVMLLLKRERAVAILLQVLIFSIVAGIITVPWALRNKQHFGVYTLSTNGGQNLFIGNNPSATGSYYDLPPELYPPVGREMESDNILKKQAISYVVNNPMAVIKIIPKKIAHLFSLESASVILLHFKGCMPKGVSYRDAIRQAPLWMHMVFDVSYAAIMLAAVWAMFLYGPSVLIQSIVLIVLFWTGVHAVYFGASRFHYPLLPLMVLAGSALFTIGPRMARSPVRMLGAIVVSLGLCGIWGAELLLAFR